MKRLFFIVTIAMATGLSMDSCKNKNANNTTDTTIQSTDTSAGYTTAPVETATDDALQTGVRDATKDYPGVTASVANGEVTLTGTIEREKWMKLKPAIDELHPKKVNNQLTVK
jgi:osmotically-inducible protein OsmY